MGYLIGVDGGGTKTEILLADDTGKIERSVKCEGINPNRVSAREISQTLSGAFRQLMDDIRFPAVEAVYVGSAGCSQKENSDLLREAVATIWPEGAPPIRVESDAQAALWSGTLGDPGIVLIAGTGSVIYGEDARGTSRIIGGWGYLAGDDGSGYDLGREVVRAVLRYYDGFGEYSLLVPLMREQFGVADRLDLLYAIYHADEKEPALPLDLFATLATEAFKQGDRTATKLMRRVARDLAAMVQKMHEKMDFEAFRPLLVMRGGLLTKDDLLSSLVEKALEEALPEDSFSISRCYLPPSAGAVMLAFHMLNKGSDLIKQNLTRSCCP